MQCKILLLNLDHIYYINEAFSCNITEKLQLPVIDPLNYCCFTGSISFQKVLDTLNY